MADDGGIDTSLPEVESGAGKTLRLDLALKTSPRPMALPMAQPGTPTADSVTEVATVAAPADSLQGQAQALAQGGTASTPSQGQVIVSASSDTQMMQLAAGAAQPAKRKTPVYTDSDAQMAAVPAKPEVVTRVSTSGAEHWGVNLGHYTTRSDAERLLLRIQLAENATLGDGLRKVVARKGGYDANFLGLSRDNADLACRRLQARGQQCFTIGQ